MLFTLLKPFNNSSWCYYPFLNSSPFMGFRNNETSEATASRLDQDRLATAAARRSQSPSSSRGTRAAATAARAQCRKQLSPEKSTEIRQKNADRQRRKANQR